MRGSFIFAAIAGTSGNIDNIWMAGLKGGCDIWNLNFRIEIQAILPSV